MEKADEERIKFLWFKKMILRIRLEGLAENESPIYLIRWSLFTCRWFAIKLHRILLSDDDCMHDHPWSFTSFVLWGGYIEWMPLDYVADHIYNKRNKTKVCGISVKDYDPRIDFSKVRCIGGTESYPVERRPGTLIRHKAEDLHRIELYRDKNGKEIPAWTFVHATGKTRRWGFVLPSGWVDYEEYEQLFGDSR